MVSSRGNSGRGAAGCGVVGGGGSSMAVVAALAGIGRDMIEANVEAPQFRVIMPQFTHCMNHPEP